MIEVLVEGDCSPPRPWPCCDMNFFNDGKGHKTWVLCLATTATSLLLRDCTQAERIDWKLQAKLHLEPTAGFLCLRQEITSIIWWSLHKECWDQLIIQRRESESSPPWLSMKRYYRVCSTSVLFWVSSPSHANDNDSFHHVFMVFYSRPFIIPAQTPYFCLQF